MIVGIVGNIGEGKDTVAEYLVKNYDFTKESFASSLKDAVSAVFGWNRFLLEGQTNELLIISIGAIAKLAVDAAKLIGATVVDPRWVKPIPQALMDYANKFQKVLVIEDGIKHGGIASTLNEQGLKAESIGIPLEFIEHSKRDQILEDLGINAQTIAARMQHQVRGI